MKVNAESKPIYVFQSKLNKKSIELANQVMADGWIGLGKVTEKFEREFAEYCGAKYCVGLNSATSALHIALKCAGVKSKDRVMSTPLTFVSTNAAIQYLGARPEFCDVDPATLTQSPEIYLDRIKFHYSQANVLPRYAVHVHFGGLAMEPSIMEMIESQCGITLINDYAHCAGAKHFDGSMAGSYGDFNTFSFHAVKNLPSPDGGALVTNNEHVYKRAKKLRWLGISQDTFSRTATKGRNKYSWIYNVDELGWKYHMNDLTAAILLGGLETLDKDNARRREIREKYREGIVNGFIKPLGNQGYQSGHMAIYQVPKGCNRDIVIERLKSEFNIHPGVHYIPNYQFKPFKDNTIDYPSDPSTWIVNDIWEELITLPCHLLMSDSDINRVIEAVNTICGD